MAKDPAFLFYSSDFLIGTMFLSHEQKGMYIELLCIQHQKGPLTEAQIEKACGRLDPEVLEKFQVNKEGKYFNKRLEEEREKRAEHSRRQREKVMKRWNKSGNTKENTKDIPRYYNGNTTVIPLENENENEIIIENKKEKRVIKGKREKTEEAELWPTFNDFWDHYEKKVGDKEKISKKFCKLRHDVKIQIMEHVTKYKQAQPDKKFRKNPETYLNNKSWNDEIIGKNTNATIGHEERFRSYK
jgi:uncharacterized protein YdaU (DUF1376 family)